MNFSWLVKIFNAKLKGVEISLYTKSAKFTWFGPDHSSSASLRSPKGTIMIITFCMSAKISLCSRSKNNSALKGLCASAREGLRSADENWWCACRQVERCIVLGARTNFLRLRNDESSQLLLFSSPFVDGIWFFCPSEGLCRPWQRAFHESAMGGLQIFIHVSAQDMRGNMFVRKISYTSRQPCDNGDEVASQAFYQPEAKLTRCMLCYLHLDHWCDAESCMHPVVKLKQVHSVH